MLRLVCFVPWWLKKSVVVAWLRWRVNRSDGEGDNELTLRAIGCYVGGKRKENRLEEALFYISPAESLLIELIRDMGVPE